MCTDLLILANGPGEVATWVRPVVQRLRYHFPDASTLRLSLVLSPCPHATGQELSIARRFPGIDRFQGAEHFFPFLLWGKTAEGWDWRDRGVVLFLGGDQFFALCCGKRLGYKILTYVEWDARWLAWIDGVAAMSPRVLTQVPAAYQHKVTIVGDLIADATAFSTFLPASEPPSAPSAEPAPEWVALLPGSKATKLGLGLPFMLAIAEYIHRHRPQTQFWIPVAPTLTLDALARYAQIEHNDLIPLIQGTAAVLNAEQGTLDTATGLQVKLVDTFPAYDRLCQSALALTTVGANTGELGALGVPMLVLLPTQHLSIMRAWDGIPGLLVRLPWIGSRLAAWLTGQVLHRNPLLAWPNIWAGKAIVPELVGNLTPAAVGEKAIAYLANPEQRRSMQIALRAARGEVGAAERIVSLVRSLMNYEL